MYKHHYVADRTPCILCLKRKHKLTGCEHNCGFYGASKKVTADWLKKSKEAQHLLLLAACGTQFTVTQEVISDLEQFVICYVDGDTKSRTLRDARAAKWRAQKKKRTIQLVPDSDSLRLHLDRTNYLAYLLKHYYLKSHLWSIGHRWQLVNGLCVCLSIQHSPLTHPCHYTQRRRRRKTLMTSWQLQKWRQWLKQL